MQEENLNEEFNLNSINAGILRLHNMNDDEKAVFLRKVKDYAKKANDILLLQLVEEIDNPAIALKRGENLKIIGIDKDTLIPIIVDKDDNTSIKDYAIDKKGNIAGLPILKKLTIRSQTNKTKLFAQLSSDEE